MSLLITNKETLKNTAIITMPYKKGEIIKEIIGDLVILKILDEVVGLNILNYSNYFDAQEGAHTINEKQIDAIGKMGYKSNNFNSLFLIGEILSKENHPKSDKLFILKVQTNKKIQIVTNATNANVGKKVIVATVGSTLPSGIPITFSKVMGIESEGMLCGTETLGLPKSDGVFITNGENGEEYIL